MLTLPIGKTLLAASASALAAAVAFAPVSANAASAEHCANLARETAASEAPRRGIVGNLVIGPLDSILTGNAGYDARWRNAYDDAYARCMNSGRIAVLEPTDTLVEPTDTLVIEEGTQAWLDYCSSKYRSFDPVTGTYTTYSGEQTPCQ